MSFRFRHSLLCLLLSVAACEKSQQTSATVAATEAQILEFTATPTVIHNGETTILNWKTKGAKAARVDLLVASLTPDGEFEVNPSISSVYTLIATGHDGKTQTASVTVDVIQAPKEKTKYPILFVTQTPLTQDANGRLSAFANHQTHPSKVPRGGDLMLIYPDGKLRNLTREAGFGEAGLQAEKAIAVREPAVHWSGKKALFSMLIGAPVQGQAHEDDLQKSRWQIYEVSDFLESAKDSRSKQHKPNIRKIEGQDERYNNLSPLYGSDDSIIFTSDRPLNGAPHLYPQLDEYEATPSVTGIWKLHGDKTLQLLNHTPSGAFNPIIDSFGRLLFTRWDHLQQDQLADRDRDALKNGVALPFKSFNFNDESAQAKKLNHRDEFFPESRVGQDSAYGKISAYRSNFFTLWQINQDGSSEETLNHIGLHELVFGYLTPSFIEDSHLSNQTSDQLHRNQLAVRREGGLFHLTEDPMRAGSYYAINARESGSFTTDTIVRLQADPSVNPEEVRVYAVTSPVKTDNLPEGRYRNPLPLSDGRLLAGHTSAHLPPEIERSLPDLRLRFLAYDDAKSYFVPQQTLTAGVRKKLQWWDGKQMREFNGVMWELEAVEVRPRNIAHRSSTVLESPERAVFAEENVNETQLRQWLLDRKLALIITRDQTSRDRADLQQPYNLQVPGGKKTLSATQSSAKVYDISHFQIVQAEQLRAYEDRPGRRNMAQSIKNFQALGNPNAQVESSVAIAKDGSTAAFVPAERALSWQTTDKHGNPIVRERNWVTLKAGEIRTCAACHGVNVKNQAEFAPPMNKPEALRELLTNWKKISKLPQK